MYAFRPRLLHINNNTFKEDRDTIMALKEISGIVTDVCLYPRQHFENKGEDFIKYFGSISEYNAEEPEIYEALEVQRLTITIPYSHFLKDFLRLIRPKQSLTLNLEVFYFFNQLEHHIDLSQFNHIKINIDTVGPQEIETLYRLD